MSISLHKKLCLFLTVMIVAMNSVGYVGKSVNAEMERSILDEIKSICGYYIANEEDVQEFRLPLLTASDEDGFLVEFIDSGESVGYAIEVDGNIVEFASHPSPYYNCSNYNCFDVLYYDVSSYMIIRGNQHLYLSTDGTIICTEDVSALSPNAAIYGVSPQLQYSYNCIVAALANVFWYWGNNGYSALKKNSFDQQKAALVPLFLNEDGEYEYANNNVPAVAYQYVSSCSSAISCNSSVYWSPSVATLIGEIDMGYPCLLGYAAGSDYSPIYGHMTMCYGYYASTSMVYVVLADGHSSSPVTRAWNGNYNDCIITIHID